MRFFVKLISGFVLSLGLAGLAAAQGSDLSNGAASAKSTQTTTETSTETQPSVFRSIFAAPAPASAKPVAVEPSQPAAQTQAPVAPEAPAPVAPQTQALAAPQTPAQAAPQTPAPTNVEVPAGSDVDLQRLSRLWQVRTSSATANDYPIGPGDVIEVNIPAIEELRDRTERISGDGKLALPYVGAIQTEGMTEKDLKAALISRMKKYMYDPQVDLFVKQYRSRQVAVIGSVAKPGLYDLASGKDTILDMISQAGGMRDDSAQRVLLIAAEENTKQPASADGEPRRATDQPPVLPALITGDVNTVLRNANSTPIVIDTRNLVRGGSQTYMALPARPGDVIVVPSAGDVLVQGWVNKPGNYHITPGLTILGALAAAGGPMFAAKMRSVKLARSGRNGEKVLMTANINRIQKGQDSDIPLQEGDVVDVEYSPVKVVPYSVYYLVNKIGFGVPIIP